MKWPHRPTAPAAERWRPRYERSRRSHGPIADPHGERIPWLCRRSPALQCAETRTRKHRRLPWPARAERATGPG
eukprot:2306867-Prymnesium_polylepis.1